MNYLRYIFTLIKMTLLKRYWILGIEKETVLFMSYDGKQYSDSPRCISEAIHLKYPKKKILWALKEPYVVCPDYVNIVNRNSKEFYRAICTAKVIITNNSISSYIPIRKNQIFLNTWHGGSPTKTVGFREENPDSYFKYHFKIQDSKTTAMLSGSKFFTEEVIKESFGFKRTLPLELGLPKNDILLNDHSSITTKVRKYYDIKPECSIILYAPTFRGDANDSTFLNKEHLLDPAKVIECFSRKNNKKYVFMFRAHHAMKVTELEGSISATDYPDMQELLCAADILITDYSSCMHDFSLMKKTVFLYIPDYEEYMKDRGFYYTIPSMPFPYAKTLPEFENVIFNYDENDYIKKVEQYLNRMNNYEDGNATERVLSWLVNKWEN